MKIEKLLKKVLEIFILFFIFFSPLIFYGEALDPFWVVEKFYFRFSFSILLILNVLYFIKTKNIGFAKTDFNLIFLLFIIVNLLGIFKVINIYSFTNKLFLNLYYILFFFLIINYLSENKENLKKVLLAIIISVSVMSLYGIFQVNGFDIFSWRSDFSGRAASTLGNPNFLAGHLVLLLPLVFAFVFLSHNKIRLIYIFLALLNTYGFIITQTRGAYLGFFVSVVFFIWLLFFYEKNIFEKEKRIFFIGSAILIFIIIFYFVFNKYAFQRIRDVLFLKDEAAHIRIALWKNSLKLFFDNFLFGTGAGNFFIKYSYYQSSSLTPDFFSKSDFYRSSHSHNDYIQIAAEYGIFGFLVFVLFIFIIFFNTLKYLKQNSENKIIVIGIISGILGLLIHAIFNFPFLIIPTSTYFYLFSGIIAFFTSQKEKIIISDYKRNILIFLILIIAILNLIFSYKTLLSNVYLRKAKENEYFSKINDAIYYAKKAVETDSLNDENNFTLANLYERTQNMMACDYFEKVYKLNPGYWEANLSLFNCFMIKNNKEMVLKIGENLYKLSPYSKKAIQSYGIALYLNQKYDEAIDIFKNGLKYFNDDYEILNYLAIVYGAKGDTQSAVFNFKKVIELKPDFKDAYYNLAVAYYSAKNYNEAKNVLLLMKKLSMEDEKSQNLLKVIKNAK